jgi:hypothetical protein
MIDQMFVDYAYSDWQDISKTQRDINDMINSGWRIKISYPYLDNGKWNHIVVIYEKDTSPKSGIQ